jgi:hypothetical protein
VTYRAWLTLISFSRRLVSDHGSDTAHTAPDTSTAVVSGQPASESRDIFSLRLPATSGCLGAKEPLPQQKAEWPRSVENGSSKSETLSVTHFEICAIMYCLTKRTLANANLSLPRVLALASGVAIEGWKTLSRRPIYR